MSGQWQTPTRPADRGLPAGAGPGDLRHDQGLRAVADRIAVGGTSGQRRQDHRVVPRHHCDRDADRRDRRRNARLADLPGLLVGNVDGVAALRYRACMGGQVIASELCISASAVSKRVATGEELLGTPLCARGDTLLMTATGREYLKQVRAALDRLAASMRITASTSEICA